ncbi:hypothetical protein EHM69_06505 [candidate division KSB1 bacterium]|nr:MAG: hypothetical protein EHM69_06505 [candidate division KSB1 bacterium]
MTRNFFFGLSVYILAIGLNAASALADMDGLSFVGDSTVNTVEVRDKVMVYYLYFTPRCETCINIELYAREAVETGFSDEISAGTVEWHSYDIGLDEYKHYRDDYKLELKSLIMVDVRNGTPVRWKNCEKIWDLVNVKPDFLNYVQHEVREYTHKN